MYFRHQGKIVDIPKQPPKLVEKYEEPEKGVLAKQPMVVCCCCLVLLILLIIMAIKVLRGEARNSA